MSTLLVASGDGGVVGTESASLKSNRSVSTALDLSFDIVAWAIGLMGLSSIEFLVSTMLDLCYGLILKDRPLAFYFVRKHFFDRGQKS